MFCNSSPVHTMTDTHVQWNHTTQLAGSVKCKRMNNRCLRPVRLHVSFADTVNCHLREKWTEMNVRWAVVDINRRSAMTTHTWQTPCNLPANDIGWLSWNWRPPGDGSVELGDSASAVNTLNPLDVGLCTSDPATGCICCEVAYCTILMSCDGLQLGSGLAATMWYAIGWVPGSCAVPDLSTASWFTT